MMAWLKSEHDVLVLNFDNGARVRVWVTPANVIVLGFLVAAVRAWRR